MITIAWDIDDVLNDLTRDWLLAQEGTSVSYEELTKNPPHEILDIGKEEYLASLDQFRLSSQYMAMKPVTEVKQWFDAHGDQFRHIAITAVPVRAAHTSASWVLREFGRWIRAYHFIPSFRAGENLPLYGDNKQAVLERLKDIDIFIDDSDNNLKGVDALGVTGLLFPRPWNHSSLSISETLEKLTEKAYQLKDKED